MVFRSTEERIKDFTDIIENDTHGQEDKLILSNAKFTKWLIDEGFFAAPASTKYHGAYEGGLYDHSRAVYERLAKLTEDNGLQWQRKESPFIVGMFHDLCKIDQYNFIEDMATMSLAEYNERLKSNVRYGHYEYNTNTLLKGHGTKSVLLLSQFVTLTEEEMLCIRYHMGAYGNEQEQKEEWAGFDRAIRKTNGLCAWVHHADQLASKIDDV